MCYCAGILPPVLRTTYADLALYDCTNGKIFCAVPSQADCAHCSENYSLLEALANYLKRFWTKIDGVNPENLTKWRTLSFIGYPSHDA
jgi:hypothetical protein